MARGVQGQCLDLCGYGPGWGLAAGRGPVPVLLTRSLPPSLPSPRRRAALRADGGRCDLRVLSVSAVAPAPPPRALPRVLIVCRRYGEVVNINLVRDKKTGKSKGFCFLCYEDQRSTILAVDNFNGIKVSGAQVLPWLPECCLTSAAAMGAGSCP